MSDDSIGPFRISPGYVSRDGGNTWFEDTPEIRELLWPQRASWWRRLWRKISG